MKLEQYKDCHLLPNCYKRSMNKNERVYDIVQPSLLLLMLCAIWVATQETEQIGGAICYLVILIPIMTVLFFKSKKAKKHTFTFNTEGVIFHHGKEVKSISYDEIDSASVVCDSEDVQTVLKADIFNYSKVYLELYDKNRETIARIPLLVKNELISIAVLMCLKTNHLLGIFNFISEKDFLKWINNQEGTYKTIEKLRDKTKQEVYFSGFKKVILGILIFIAIFTVPSLINGAVSPLEILVSVVKVFVSLSIMTLPIHFVVYRHTVLILEQFGELKN